MQRAFCISRAQSTLFALKNSFFEPNEYIRGYPISDFLNKKSTSQTLHTTENTLCFAEHYTINAVLKCIKLLSNFFSYRHFMPYNYNVLAEVEAETAEGH